MRELHIDGLFKDGTLQGAADEKDTSVTAPFYVFDADAQQNIAGPYLTYAEADNNRRAILNGHEPAAATTADAIY